MQETEGRLEGKERSRHLSKVRPETLMLEIIFLLQLLHDRAWPHRPVYRRKERATLLTKCCWKIQI